MAVYLLLLCLYVCVHWLSNICFHLFLWPFVDWNSMEKSNEYRCIHKRFLGYAMQYGVWYARRYVSWYGKMHLKICWRKIMDAMPGKNWNGIGPIMKNQIEKGKKKSRSKTTHKHVKNGSKKWNEKSPKTI